MSELKNPAFDTMDELLDVAMDDLADLPPIGVPPSGHYDLEVSASREEGKDGKADYIQVVYTVDAINELADADEAGEVAVGQTFTIFFSPFTKDGKVNDTGLGYLKKELLPYKQHFGTNTVGETLAEVNKVKISANVKRVQDRKQEDRFNARITEVIVK
jgi:hypothetical protein